MTDLQACEFEMLKEIVSVCEKLHIRYYMVCGSALGAVKYNGFIPWDDDVDIGMFRDDYERFLKEAPALLPTHLFLQNFRSDRQFSAIYSKVRHNGTTYIEKNSQHLRINHGVYIDVFPLDGYPSDKAEQVKLERKKRYYKFICESSFCFHRSPRADIVTKILRLCGIRYLVPFFLSRYDRLISAPRVSNSDIVCNHGNWQGKLEYAPKWHYGEGVMMPFEGMTVRVPEHYDEYLTQKYGDWRADLPEDQKIGHHYYEVMDLEKPYTEYIKR